MAPSVPPALPQPPPLPVTGGVPLIQPLTDFADWLSPMLVKELRQGLRTRVFVGLFVGVHIALLFMLLIAISAGGRGQSGIGYFFWWITAMVLVLLQPIRAGSALQDEITGQTMDLLQLSSLSAWRITFGKWASMVAQGGLVAISVLPYVVLRYFVGGVDIVRELLFLLALWLLSALWTALLIGLSGIEIKLLRMLLRIGSAVWLLSVLAAGIMAFLEPSARIFIRVSGPLNGFVLAAAVPLFIAWWVRYCLALGATMISPPAENLSTRKRLWAVVWLAALIGGSLISGHVGSDLGWLGQLSLLLIGLDALSEPIFDNQASSQQFARHGVMGRFFGHFFAPGWATGLLFYLLLSAVWIGFLALHSPRADELQCCVLIAGSLLPGLLLTCWKPGHRLGGMIAVLLIGLVYGAVIMLIVNNLPGKHIAAWASLPSPLGVWMTSQEVSSGLKGSLLNGGLITVGAMLLAAMLLSFRSHRALAREMKGWAGVRDVAR
jgi:ABC-type transport system involved in multi-copper enzyme maturation permease subunit